MNNLPERLEQIDFSENSQNRERLRAQLISKAWGQLPKQAKRQRQNEQFGLFIRFAVVTTLIAVIIVINWRESFFTSTPEAAAPAIDINQIVSATFQAMTQVSQPANKVTSSETPTQGMEISPMAPPVAKSATQDNPQSFISPVAETPSTAPMISQAPVQTSTPRAATMPKETRSSTDAIPTRTTNAKIAVFLPTSLYFIRHAASPTGDQIFRLEKDGKTITQITSEVDAGVIGFDFSFTQNRIVYIAGDQLILSDPEGSNREASVNLDGNSTSSPRWSPDGQTIAYQDNGKIYFYSAQTGTSTLILEDSSGEKIYSPEEFSPNSQKLLIKSSTITSSGQDELIYDIPSKTLTAIQPLKPNGTSPLGYVMTDWADPNTIFGFYPTSGPAGAGLWQVNANDGSIVSLISSPAVPPLTGVLAPHRANNGDLLYLYTLGEAPDSPFSLVSSSSDGITNRTTIRPETFMAFDALWSPNGDSLLLLQTGDPVHSATSLVLIPVDPSLPVITLLPDASGVGEIFRWGP